MSASGLSASSGSPVQDDRVLAGTRTLGAVVVPVLVVAITVLFVLPDQVGHLFAWPIKPHMSAFILASAYAGGLYFFVRLLLDGRWHHVAAGLPAIWAFVSVEGIATIVHWDRFNHTNPAFWLWTFLYFTTPILIPLVWLRNRPTDSGAPEAADVVIPFRARVGFGITGTIQVGVGLFLLLFPETAIRVWGWTLSPLTSRSTSGWFVLGVGGLLIAFDQRWSGARVLVESLLIALAVLVIGIARAWNEFDTGRVATWLFLAGVATGTLFLAGLYLTMQRRLHARPPARGTGTQRQVNPSP